MARHAWLALPEDLRHFADRQLHRPQQRDDPQAGGVRQRAENVDDFDHGTSISETGI